MAKMKGLVAGFDDISCGKTVKVSDYYQNITQMLMLERVFGQVFPQFMKVSSSTAVKNAQGTPVNLSLGFEWSHNTVRYLQLSFLSFGPK